MLHVLGGIAHPVQQGSKWVGIALVWHTKAMIPGARNVNMSGFAACFSPGAVSVFDGCSSAGGCLSACAVPEHLPLASMLWGTA